jgi:hypothetical protein
MARILTALAFALLLTSPVMAQDAVLMRIEADNAAWKQYLSEQYTRHGLSRGDYERQLQDLERSIEARRATRQAELAEIQRKRNLEERQTRALEQIANQPPVVQQPSGPMNCTVQSWGSGRSTVSCY